MPETSMSGARVAWASQGRGEPGLLLLPGWCETRAVFEPLVRRLARARRVVTLDWRGHGESGTTAGDYGTGDLVADALAVIEAARLRAVVPVASAHAGWVAIALQRRLGARVPALVALDWLMLEPPPAFRASLAALQDPMRWEDARAHAFEQWKGVVRHPRVEAHVERDMARFGFRTWARASRAVAASYARARSPLDELAELPKRPQTLHLYTQPRDAGFLATQERFAAEHPWFHVHRLDGGTHFSSLESPREVARAIERFVAQREREATRSWV